MRRSTIATKGDNLRINDEIKSKEVRVIDEEGRQVGLLTIETALAKAAEMQVDLVEISPDADPPVCKLIDYGKFLYQKEKKLKEARKKQKVIEIKEMKFRPKIDNHDFEYRIKQIKGFLEEGDKVKITIRFRGRELVHANLGFELADRVIEAVKELGVPDKRPKMEGKSIAVVISSLKK
jgi:translation initiation factor IF-3